MTNISDVKFDRSVLHKFLHLPLPADKIQATYIWIDWNDIRSKDRTLHSLPKSISDYPAWSCVNVNRYETEGLVTEAFLQPAAIYKDPFKPGGSNVLVLCDTYNFNNEPTPENARIKCMEAVEQAAESQPWFGIEQEYYLLDNNGRPWGWPSNRFPAAYCGVGNNKVFARELVEAHYRACLYAGIDIGGTNAECMISQWEFQIGPSEGIKCADDLWVARYILLRIAEEYGIGVTFDPKPVEGDWSCSGAHVNFSTKQMRERNGIIEIEKAIDKLSKQHLRHIQAYDPKGGEDNKRRLTGVHQTSFIDKFSAGVDDRDASVRIPKKVALEKEGYLEDRRPASNCDPYSVCNAIIRTCILNE